MDKTVSVNMNEYLNSDVIVKEEQMTAEMFCYWLQGYVELNGNIPTGAQWISIKEHLALVFNKVTSEIVNTPVKVDSGVNVDILSHIRDKLPPNKMLEDIVFKPPYIATC